ncbi:MAG TPA: thioredoxin domain-containing protein [Polyangia bacterium]|jgi:hypothetical protein
MPNRLAREASPYLRQHQDNPVDWYPWGEEALARARAEDRPILLSIGYATCHWCHVMAHETFEDPAVARLMNERFVCIKVDREEMPDVDAVYQQALALTGEPGGWPLTMFLTPEEVPYFGGTYFPPRDQHGRPAFSRLLATMADAYQSRRASVMSTAGEMRRALAAAAAPAGSPAERLLPDAVERAATRLGQQLDRRNGGFAGAPKFPSPSALELCLRAGRRLTRAGDPDGAELTGAVRLTLTRMAEGGLYDQLGGGFARYSTDAAWLVPHFEKMLYDNAQLLGLYAVGWQLFGEPRFAEVVRETAAYLERELRQPEGGLATAQDADSEGVEGKYYVWTPAEVRAVLGAADAELVERALDVTPEGNWLDPHGHGPAHASILHVAGAPLTPADEPRLAAAKRALLAARQRRVPPATDDKVLAGMNGLAVTGLAEAGRILGDAALVGAARRTAAFVLDRMVGPDGRLRRTYRAGVATLPGTLDDHAFVAQGLLTLYEATGEGRWVTAAHRLTALALELFHDLGERDFYLTGRGDPALIQRPRSQHDGALPSGMSVCLMNLIRLGDATGEARFGAVADEVVRAHHDAALRSPFGYANFLNALDLYQEGVTAIVLAGAPLDELARAVAAGYLPNRFIARAAGAPAELAPLVAGKGAVGGRPAAYVCRRFACQAPTTDPAALRAALGE